MFGEHKYHFNDDNRKVTFKEAEKICKNEGGTLPVLARKMDKSAIRSFNDKNNLDKYFRILELFVKFKTSIIFL